MRSFYCLTAVLAMLVAGCLSVPSHMRVVEGIDPDQIDKKVRFRTTYYFRVFDECADEKSDVPDADSLYRFRMTGKANSVTNKIRFESGTLKSYQIDPFGASVEYDDKTNKLKFVPSGSCGKGGGCGSQDSGTQSAGGTQSGNAAQANANNSGNAPTCENGQLQRGFQIMGPEGIRTFDQDDRLLMAMSVSGKPLLSALKEISGRYVAAGARPSTAELLLPVAREDIRVLKAERELLRAQTVLNEQAAAVAVATAARQQQAPAEADGDEAAAPVPPDVVVPEPGPDPIPDLLEALREIFNGGDQ